jgi:hypothetical protein
LLATGCSSGGKETSGPGAAGNTASVAGSAGSAGASAAQGGSGDPSGGESSNGGAAGTAGGTIVLGDSKTEACIAYALATCTRLDLCTLRPTTLCLQQQTFSCPDLTFSDGASRTAAEVKACAQEIMTFPCDKLAAGYIPDCVRPGTRTGGQSCAFPSQCASLTCNAPKGVACGVCATPGALGADCSSPDVACNAGLRCGASNTCEQAPPDASVAVEEGHACDSMQICMNGLYCASPSMVCTKRPALGMPCSPASYCQTGSYCAIDTSKCTLNPPLGAACGVSAEYTGYCDNTSYCSAGVCTALPALGTPCLPDPTTGMINRIFCTDGGHCDTSVAAPVCVAKGAPGVACDDGGDCQDGLLCSCPDTAYCATPVCTKFRFAGESCGEPGMPCHPGFSCTNGHCAPRDSQGTFATCPG